MKKKKQDNTIFKSPTADLDGTIIQAMWRSIDLFAGQRRHLDFSVMLRPWVLILHREWNPQPPALHSSALPNELILLWLKHNLKLKYSWAVLKYMLLLYIFAITHYYLKTQYPVFRYQLSKALPSSSSQKGPLLVSSCSMYSVQQQSISFGNYAQNS